MQLPATHASYHFHQSLRPPVPLPPSPSEQLLHFCARSAPLPVQPLPVRLGFHFSPSFGSGLSFNSSLPYPIQSIPFSRISVCMCCLCCFALVGQSDKTAVKAYVSVCLCVGLDSVFACVAYGLVPAFLLPNLLDGSLIWCLIFIWKWFWFGRSPQQLRILFVDIRSFILFVCCFCLGFAAHTWLRYALFLRRCSRLRSSSASLELGPFVGPIFLLAMA